MKRLGINTGVVMIFLAGVQGGVFGQSFASPATGLTHEGRYPDQTGDAAAIEATELGNFGQEGARQRIADAGNRDEQIFLLAPGRRARKSRHRSPKVY